MWQKTYNLKTIRTEKGREKAAAGLLFFFEEYICVIFCDQLCKKVWSYSAIVREKRKEINDTYDTEQKRIISSYLAYFL